MNVVIIGLASVAAIAVLVVLLVWVRRRRVTAEQKDDAAALGARRARRRAAMRLTEDPIVASLGLGADEDRRSRARAGRPDDRGWRPPD